MKRRNFIKTVSASVAAASIKIKPGTESANLPVKQIIKPPRLKEGDTIALVTPGSYITQEEKNQSLNNLNELGFSVNYSDHLMKKNGFLAGTDRERANDLNDMFEREDINGIVCARGGYGCARILPYLDYNLIRKNPKPFIGFSDVTAIQYALYKNCGLVSFHGPVGISSFTRFSKKHFNDVLMNPSQNMELVSSSNGNNYNVYGLTTIAAGTAQGEFVGGNLSIVASMVGTEYDIDTSGKIIFLEEFLEEPYRIDRMLTQMLQAGKFDGAAAVALGVFKMCEPDKNNPAFSNSFSLMEVLKDRLSDLNIPVAYGLSFGHVVDKFMLPFGIRAELDADEKKITLLEQAVM
jgi:muramoyltetrapeptide carboxypeptidase